MTFEPPGLLDIQVLNVQIIDVGFGIWFKEEVLLEQTESQALEVMVESLDINLAGLSVLTRHIPVEHIPCIQHLFLFHALIEAPDSWFEEMYLHFLLLLVFNWKPNILLSIKFIDKLEKWAPLQQSVTDFIFNRSKHLEKLSVIDLGVSQKRTQRVCNSCLQFQ